MARHQRESQLQLSMCSQRRLEVFNIVFAFTVIKKPPTGGFLMTVL